MIARAFVADRAKLNDGKTGVCGYTLKCGNTKMLLPWMRTLLIQHVFFMYVIMQSIAVTGTLPSLGIYSDVYDWMYIYESFMSGHVYVCSSTISPEGATPDRWTDVATACMLRVGSLPIGHRHPQYKRLPHCVLEEWVSADDIVRASFYLSLMIEFAFMVHT